MRDDRLAVLSAPAELAPEVIAWLDGPLPTLTFLPTAHQEGGPAPVDVRPGGAAWAAAQAARLSRRGLTDTAAPPWLRRVLVRFAGMNLDWASAGLEIEARDGPDRREL